MGDAKKPKMVNAFIDEATGIFFIIPNNKQLLRKEAENHAMIFITKEKDNLFKIWKLKPKNKNWSGNELAKKNELFAKTHPPGSEMFLFQPNE